MTRPAFSHALPDGGAKSRWRPVWPSVRRLCSGYWVPMRLVRPEPISPRDASPTGERSRHASVRRVSREGLVSLHVASAGSVWAGRLSSQPLSNPVLVETTLRTLRARVSVAVAIPASVARCTSSALGIAPWPSCCRRNCSALCRADWVSGLSVSSSSDPLIGEVPVFRMTAVSTAVLVLAGSIVSVMLVLRRPRLLFAWARMRSLPRTPQRLRAPSRAPRQPRRPGRLASVRARMERR